MKKAVVTGAGGFIGGKIVSILLEKGVSVYGVDVSEKAVERFKKYDNFNAVTAEFSMYPKLSEIIEERDFDVFLHFAWCGYGKDTNNFDVQIKNVTATRQAANQAVKLGCKKFLMACSSHEYQMNCYNNTPGKVVGPCSIYGASKTAAKTYAKVECHNGGIAFNGVIFTNVFGVGDRSARTANLFIKKLLAGQDLDLIPGDNLYDWTYIDDVANMVIAAAERGTDGKEYYVGSKTLCPFKEIITRVRDIVSPSSKLNFGVFPDTSYIDYSGIDIDELYNDTGVCAQCDFKKSILKTAEWVKTLDIKV